MKSLLPSLIIVCFALLIGFGEARVHAATISESSTLADGETQSFAKFNEALGTLDSVAIANVFFGLVPVIFRQGNLGETGVLTGFVTADITSSTGLFLPAAGFWTLPYSLPEGSLALSTNVSGTTSTGPSFPGPSFLPDYVGPGSFTVTRLPVVSGITGGDSIGGAEILSAISITADVTVTYEYTPNPSIVPIPAALPLLLTSLAGLGLVGRRRRSKS